MKYKLTQKQYEFFTKLKPLLQNSGVPPSFNEISSETGRIKSEVHRYCHALRERGYIDFIDGRARTMILLED